MFESIRSSESLKGSCEAATFSFPSESSSKWASITASSTVSLFNLGKFFSYG